MFLPPSLISHDMRRSIVVLTTLFAATSVVAASQFPIKDQTPGRPLSDPSFPQAGMGFDGVVGSSGGQGVTLADTLTIDRKGSLWWDYARDLSTVVRHALWQYVSCGFVLIPDRSVVCKGI